MLDGSLNPVAHIQAKNVPMQEKYFKTISCIEKRILGRGLDARMRPVRDGALSENRRVV
jgi:hypothetical protein